MNLVQTETFPSREAAKTAASKLTVQNVPGIEFEDSVVGAEIDGTEFFRGWKRPVFKSLDAVLAEFNGDLEGALSAFTYGQNLKLNGKIRAQLVEENGDPSAGALEKLAKDIVKQREKLGKTITIEAARDLAKNILGL